jgi:hypothetical protein
MRSHVLMKIHSLVAVILLASSLMLLSGCSDLLDQLMEQIPFLNKQEEPVETPGIIGVGEDTPIKTSGPPEGTAPGGTEGATEGAPAVPEGTPAVPEGTPAVPEGAGNEGTEIVTPPEGTETPAPETGEDGLPGEGGEVGEAPAPGEATPEEGTVPEGTEGGGPEGVTPGEVPPPETTGTDTGPTVTDDFGMDIAMITTDGAVVDDGGTDLEDFFYDTRNRRDPFKPFTMKNEPTEIILPEEDTPLMKLKLAQLTLKAIIYDPELGTGVAMVEDPARNGFTLYVGTGVAGGRVVGITEEEVRVEVRYMDYLTNEEAVKIETLTLSGGQ